MATLLKQLGEDREIVQIAAQCNGMFGIRDPKITAQCNGMTGISDPLKFCVGEGADLLVGEGCEIPEITALGD